MRVEKSEHRWRIGDVVAPEQLFLQRQVNSARSVAARAEVV